MLASALVLASRGVLALAGEATAPAAAALVPGVAPADAFAAAVGVPALPPVTAQSEKLARAQALSLDLREGRGSLLLTSTNSGAPGKGSMLSIAALMSWIVSPSRFMISSRWRMSFS